MCDDDTTHEQVGFVYQHTCGLNHTLVYSSVWAWPAVGGMLPGSDCSDRSDCGDGEIRGRLESDLNRGSGEDKN